VNVSHKSELNAAPIFAESVDTKAWSEDDGYRRFHLKRFIRDWCGVSSQTPYGLRLTSFLRTP
jgi:hypothetical protein